MLKELLSFAMIGGVPKAMALWSLLERVMLTLQCRRSTKACFCLEGELVQLINNTKNNSQCSPKDFMNIREWVLTN